MPRIAIYFVVFLYSTKPRHFISSLSCNLWISKTKIVEDNLRNFVTYLFLSQSSLKIFNGLIELLAYIVARRANRKPLSFLRPVFGKPNKKRIWGKVVLSL